jgi:carnitine-CoA ligase
MTETPGGGAWDRVPEWLRDLDTSQLTVATLLQHRAERSGEAPFVAADGEWFGAAELLRHSLLWTGRFESAGVQRGERVAIMSRNRMDFLMALLGASLGGFVPVVVNAELRSAQLQHVLSDSRPRVLISDADALDQLASVDRTDVGRFWCFDAVDAPPTWLSDAPELGHEGEVAPVTSASPFVVIYTSGTTGPPKGVVCPQAQFFWWGVNTGAELRLTPDDVLHTTLPLFHTNALSSFFQALVFEARFVLGSRFSASRYWTELVDVDATVSFLLGAMITILLRRDRSEFDPGHRVRVALSPATPPGLTHAFRQEFSVDLLEAYGSTETNHVISTPLDARRDGWMGRVLPGFEARVVDEVGIPLDAGAAGQLVLRHREPFSVALGYLNAPDTTLESWRDHWFQTGDRVVASDDGWFRFMDRLTDSLRRRGENISTHEVESAVAAHPAVGTAAAFGVPSDLGEQDVMVVVTSAPSHEVEPAELLEFCRARLARFAVPRYVRIVDEIPLTETGKVRKTGLRDEGVTADTYDVESQITRRSRT